MKRDSGRTNYPAPLVVGIAGGTASGKTTVAESLGRALPPGTCGLIEHDSYYRDRSGIPPAERELINYDHPDALESDLLARDLAALRAGRTVKVPIYDFVTHTRRVQTRRVEPTHVILVDGILVLVDEAVRRQLDIKVFVDTDADIRALRRVERDLHQRGRTFASVYEQYHRTVRPMHMQFVEPSKRWADIIIPGEGANQVALDMLLSRLRSTLA